MKMRPFDRPFQSILLTILITAAEPVAAVTPSVSGGETHSLFLKEDGMVWVCGRGSNGALGTGNSSNRSYLTSVFGPAREISAGYNHSLILRVDGTAWATGYNSVYQLGDGTTTTRFAPVEVLSGVEAIAAGHQHSLFLREDGTAWGCGSDPAVGGGGGVHYTPRPILEDVQAISAGYQFSFFLKNNGTLYAAGNNSYGQLGNGTTTWAYTPVQVMTGVKAISAGYRHSLILKTDDTAWATGFNGHGQLGDGTANQPPSPVQVMTGVKAIAAGGNHSLFLKNDGTAWATGHNLYGQVGDGTTTQRYTPVQVLSGVASIAAGHTHSLFVATDDTTLTCGLGNYYQLGTGASSPVYTPTPVVNLHVPVVAPAITTQPVSQQILVGNRVDFTVTATGTSPFLYQWQFDGTDIPGADAATYTIADVQVANAGSYICAITNGVDTTLSDPAALTVAYAPTIAPVPATLTFPAGSEALLTLTADGTEPLTYQWKKNGVEIPGGDTASLTLSAVSFTDEADYTCEVSNVAGSAESLSCQLVVSVEIDSTDSDGDGLCDALESYLRVLGLDPAVPSTTAKSRLAALVPGLGEFYTSDQMQDLAVGQPLITVRPDGMLEVNLDLQECTNLSDWNPIPVEGADLSASGGLIRIEVEPTDAAARFFRLGFRPKP